MKQIDLAAAEHVARLKKEGLSWSEIGSMMDIHPEKARGLHRRYLLRQQIDSLPPVEDSSEDFDPRVIFENKKTPNPPTWRELIEHAARAKEFNESSSVFQEEASVHIETDRPVGIVYTGDWHLGDSAVDYQAWAQDINRIVSNPMLKMIVLGDTNQNMRTFKVLAGVLNQVLSPAQQGILMKELITEMSLRHKILAFVTGNHDLEFDERTFGEAVHKFLYAGMEAPLFPNRGVLRISVGTEERRQVYTCLLFHKSRFRSFMRPTHGAYREWQMSYPAEIVAGAHDHTPGLEQLWGYDWPNRLGEEYGGHTILVKIGAYQRSEFGYRYFHNGGYPIMPTVVLHPDEHRKVAFTNAVDAETYLNTWKGKNS